eukprot:15457754-Alexandrium_andersonii.AAC.1
MASQLPFHPPRAKAPPRWVLTKALRGRASDEERPPAAPCALSSPAAMALPGRPPEGEMAT